MERLVTMHLLQQRNGARVAQLFGANADGVDIVEGAFALAPNVLLFNLSEQIHHPLPDGQRARVARIGQAEQQVSRGRHGRLVRRIAVHLANDKVAFGQAPASQSLEYGFDQNRHSGF